MLISRKKIYFLIFALVILILVALGLWWIFRPQEPLKFGFTTDIHCYGEENEVLERTVLNWRCKKPMDRYVKKMNESFNPNFVIDGGDFVEGAEENPEQTLEVFNILQEDYNEILAPKYYVLGNHEVRKFDKNNWLDLVSQANSYYYFDINKYRIIVLDGNFAPQEEGEATPAGPGNDFYPGFIDNEQMQWLKELLKESKKYQKIVFIHQPLLDKTLIKNKNQLLVNGEELRELFAEHQVMAVFSGHIEELCHVKLDGVEYFTLPGFYKTILGHEQKYRFKDSGSFYAITLDKKEINIEMFYQESREAEFKSVILDDEFIKCDNQSLGI